jgi:hypothetical protein
MLVEWTGLDYFSTYASFAKHHVMKLLCMVYAWGSHSGVESDFLKTFFHTKSDH